MELPQKFRIEALQLLIKEKQFAGSSESIGAQLKHAASEGTQDTWIALDRLLKPEGTLVDLRTLKVQKTRDNRLEKLWADNAEELNEIIRNAEKSANTMSLSKEKK